MAVQNERFQLEIGPTANVLAGTALSNYRRVPGPTGAKYYVAAVHALIDAAMTANATNYTTMTLKDETTSTTIATRAWSATDSTAASAESLAITAGVTVTAGDILSWNKVESGSGLQARVRCNVELVRLA